MRVLITGGYGFIGSHVADKFYKEGHEVYIIDNLSTGNIENISFKHKGYTLDVADGMCEEIFATGRFDFVIHLAAQVDVKTSVQSPYLDARSNVLGLVNMLNLSVKHGVKKFIFASSAAVYGNTRTLPVSEKFPCKPISPYGLSKYVGEVYCRKWSTMYGLNTVCFRFSNVYGPRQGIIGEGGVVSIFTIKTLNNQDIIVFGDGNQTRDFIYVVEVANVIYKSLNAKISGVLNLSTNTETSVNELISILSKLHKPNKILYKKRREGDIYRSKLDNSKISTVLNWQPDTSFEYGVIETFKWFRKYEGYGYKAVL